MPDSSLSKDYEFEFFVEVSMLEIYNETVKWSSFRSHSQDDDRSKIFLSPHRPNPQVLLLLKFAMMQMAI
jgi:hypothetical protein